MVRDIGALVGDFYELLWNRWDDDAVEATLAPGFRFRGSLGQETTGRDGWRAYRDQVRRGAPDFANEVVELVTDGERAAARLRYSGTHAGPLLGIPAPGRRFTTRARRSSPPRPVSSPAPGSSATWRACAVSSPRRAR
jgi:hypothetical protein